MVWHHLFLGNPTKPVPKRRCSDRNVFVLNCCKPETGLELKHHSTSESSDLYLWKIHFKWCVHFSIRLHFLFPFSLTSDPEEHGPREDSSSCSRVSLTFLYWKPECVCAIAACSRLFPYSDVVGRSAPYLGIGGPADWTVHVRLRGFCQEVIMKENSGRTTG